MVEQELVAYIKRALAKGLSLGQIKKTLVEKGWAEKDIIEAMNFASPKKTSGKNSKLLIVIIILLGLIVLAVVVYFIFSAGRAGEKTDGETEELSEEEQAILAENQKAADQLRTQFQNENNALSEEQKVALQAENQQIADQLRTQFQNENNALSEEQQAALQAENQRAADELRAQFLAGA